MQTILVTGGAGYIGSATVYVLYARGNRVVVVDCAAVENFSLQGLLGEQVHYVQADYANEQVIIQLCERFAITAVVHCAALIEVGQSVIHPAVYYEVNVAKTALLLRVLHGCGVTRIVFSSSCAVYGIPQTEFLDEQHMRMPISPYGRTKMMVEMMLEDYAHAYAMQYGIVRYFNAAGALPELAIGERHEPETHLIPRVFQAAIGRTPVTIFGTSYATVDGTAVRDYVHIADLAQAHCLMLEYLYTHTGSLTCNLGTGRGYSVEQIVQAVEEVTGITIDRRYADPRPGDPARLVARAQRAYDILGWCPVQSELDTIITSVYQYLSMTLNI